MQPDRFVGGESYGLPCGREAVVQWKCEVPGEPCTSIGEHYFVALYETVDDRYPNAGFRGSLFLTVAEIEALPETGWPEEDD